MISLAKQKGTAAILFAIMVPALFGIFVLGTDATKALQEKARLLDATEAASLAVSARTVDTDSNIDLTEAKALVHNYLSAYLSQDFDVNNIDIIKKHCDQIPECVANLEQGGNRYYQYEVVTNTELRPWFQGDLNTMPDSYSVSGRSVVNKFQNRAIDVALVADFSGSMQNNWNGGSQRKYKDLFDVVSDVLKELQKYNELHTDDKNHVAFIPYNRYTSPMEATVPFEKDGTIDDRRCFMSYRLPTGYKRSITGEEAQQTVDNWLNPLLSNGVPFFYQHEIDLRDIHGDKGKHEYREELGCALNYRNLKRSHDEYDKNYTIPFFWDLGFTHDFEQLETTVRSFYPSGYTASYQGLIRAGQIFKQRIAAGNANDRRLLIILSDGIDTPAGITPVLQEKGLCEVIRNALSEPENDIHAKIALIGFDYNVLTTNAALRACVGNDNVYQANNRDEILNAILELITEEIGRLTPDTAASK